jgi:putative nucleotidyltransferase with HDIG domain
MNSLQEERSGSEVRIQRLKRRSLLWIFVGVLAIVTALILAFNLVTGPQISVNLGEPAPQDVIAPQSITYVSDVLTTQARQQAAASVSNQYTPVDLSIARAQNNLARAVFSFIEVVRADSLADKETKIGNLQAIEGLAIDEQVAEDILSLSQSEFGAVRENTLQIVEGTMRQGVVQDQLSEAKRRASLGAAFDLTPAQERVVTSLAPQFVVPNIFFDEEGTSALQEEAMAAVEAATQIVTKDQRVLRVGDIVSDEDLEMLEQLGLLQPKLDWRRAISAILAALLAVILIALYWNLYFYDKPHTARSLTIVGILLALFVLSAKLLVSTRSIYSILYPAAAFSIIVAVIFETRLAIFLTMIQAALVGYIAQESLELAVYAAAGGILAVLTLRDVQRLNALFRAGLVAAVGNIVVVLMFRLPTDIAPTELLTLLLFGLVTGSILSAGLALAGIFLIGSIFGVITPLQLQELSRLDHPLLQELLRKAPGTYHHSIMVANLAEQGAEKVKANSPLVRVGAFYHDIGKMNRPEFFSENQNGGNPHDNLDPFSSARIIISHVTDGLELARRYHLPSRIRDFIAEHHGDRVLKSFYGKALEAAGGEKEAVERARFRYNGPRPTSRETGIVQLADSIEATSRALGPNTEEEIERLVNKIVDEHLGEGQLDHSGLTLGDIQLLKESFIKTVKGRFHVRVRYPGNEELEVGESRQAELTEAVMPAPARPEADVNAVEQFDEAVRR